MSKSDLSWILVKFLGVILLYIGITGLYGAFTSWMTLKELLEGLSESGRERASAPIHALIYGSFLPLGFGTYLLVSGRLLYSILMSMPGGHFDCSQVPGAISGVNLSEEELQKFENWLSSNPDIARRSRVDQVALFRDAQATENQQVEQG